MTRPPVSLLRRLRPLLDRTLDLDPEEREAFLARLARDEPAVARELAALLAVEPVLDAARFLSGGTLAGDWSGAPRGRPAPETAVDPPF
jgi:hypothetical protein